MIKAAVDGVRGAVLRLQSAPVVGQVNIRGRHSELLDRDAMNQHPIDAVEGLRLALAAIPDRLMLEGNMLYLARGDMILSDGVRLPSGATGNKVASVITLRNEMDSNTLTVPDSDDPILLRYIAASLDATTNEPTGELLASWYVNGTRVAAEAIQQGGNSFNIRPYLYGDESTVKIVVSDSYGESGAITWAISVSSADAYIPGGDWSAYTHAGTASGVTINEDGTVSVSRSSPASATQTMSCSAGCNTPIDFSPYSTISITFDVASIGVSSGGRIDCTVRNYNAASGSAYTNTITQALKDLVEGENVITLDVADWAGVGYLGMLFVFYRANASFTITSLTLS